MGKRRVVSGEEVLQALGYGVVHAIHHAPESLLLAFSGPGRDGACRRLAFAVVSSLAGDGWGEGECAKGSEGLEEAIVSGVRRIDDCFLRTLPEARRCNGKVLDAIGLHFAGAILAAMADGGVTLRRNRWRRQPPHQSG